MHLLSVPALIELKIEPKSKTDLKRLAAALSAMALEDRSFHLLTHSETGEILLGGTSETHLDKKLDILKGTYGVEVLAGPPQVAYRETPSRATDVDYTHKKQTGGAGQFARVKLTIEPNEIGKGNAFEASAAGGTVPKVYVPGVEKGVRSVLDSGILIGFPMIDVKVNLYDGAFHEIDSSATAFEIAARAAMKEGCEMAGVNILEPIMDIELLAPLEFVASILGDLNSRRGRIRNQDLRSDNIAIGAYVPLANLFSYSSALNSLSEGSASFTMKLYRYEPVKPWDGPDRFPPAVGIRA